METYYERSLRSKYRSQGVQTSFYESTPSPTNSLGDKISTGSKRSFGHAGTNHPYAPKERNNGSASRLARVLLERIPGKKGFRRVTSSHRSKESERTHSRTSFPYVHDKLCSKLRRKRRLRVQDRSAGCVLSCTDSSKQQEIPQVRLRKQGVPVSSTTFRSKYSPSSFYSFGAHGDSIPAPSGGFGDTISGRLASSPPGPSNFITTSGSANRYARPGRLHSESKEIRAGPYSGSPVPRNSLTSGPRESFTPRVQGWGDSRLRHLSSLKVLNYSQVSHLMGSLNWASGLIPLGRLYLRPLQRHFHSLGLTNRFTPPRKSDPVVLANLLRQWLDPHFLTSGIPIRPFQADYTIFTDASSQGWGAHMGDSKISGIWTCIDRKLHINCLELKAVTCALQHWAPLLQGHQVMIATDNSTVVSYINKQGGTRSTSLLRLTVEFFLWLESQDIIVRARHIPGCLNVIADHLSRPNQPIPTEWSLHPEIVKRIFRFWGTPEVDMFATLSNSHLPRFMSPVPEPRALAVDALSQDWQGRSMYMFPPFPLVSKVVQKLRSTQVAEVILVAPWWPSQPWFPHLLHLCVEHPLILPYRQDLLSQQDQKYISDGKSFHLHVWRLSCDTTKQQAFQTRSLGSRQLLLDPRPISCMTTDGVVLRDGLRDKLLIHLTPQPLR